MGEVPRDESPVRTGHVGDHPAGYFGRFGGDGAGLGGGVVVVAAGVGVAACGDEEGEVEESGMLSIRFFEGEGGEWSRYI